MNILPKDVQCIIGYYVWSESIIGVNNKLKRYTCDIPDFIELNFTYSTIGCEYCHVFKINNPQHHCGLCYDTSYNPNKIVYNDYRFGWCGVCYGYVYLFSNGKCRRMWNNNHFQEYPVSPEYCGCCKYKISSCECWYDDPLLIGDKADFLAREYYIENDDY